MKPKKHIAYSYCKSCQHYRECQRHGIVNKYTIYCPEKLPLKRKKKRAGMSLVNILYLIAEIVSAITYYLIFIG
jgi:Pyruvate/2-oxoacid:ferredoxin oxidoreductase delta subunit